MGTGPLDDTRFLGHRRKLIEEIRAKGGKVVREPGPMMHGTTVLAFVEDPDGYKIELLSADF